MGSDSTAISEEIQQNLLIIRVKTTNRWEHAEMLGTDNHIYPSKNVEGKETWGKCTDVRGNRSTRNPGLMPGFGDKVCNKQDELKLAWLCKQIKKMGFLPISSSITKIGQEPTPCLGIWSTDLVHN